MSLEIEEQLQIRAPVEKVWRFLIDAERVVTCLPGAELTKVEDARTFLGNMKVKVGPVTVAYQGRVKMTEIDDAAHRVRMSGEGTEKGGTGAAKMTMESQVVEKDGGSLVTVQSKVDIAGRIVQFGRGMVKGVAQQMFKQFAANVRNLLEQPEAAPPPPPPASPPAPTETAAPAAVPEPAAAPTPTPPIQALAPHKPAEPLRLLPLIFKAMLEPFRRFFARLFRRRAA